MNLIFEERRWWQLGGEEEEGRFLLLPLVLPGLLRLNPLEAVQVRRDDLLGVDLHGAEEVFVDDGGFLFLSTAERHVERVEEPGQEHPRVSLLRDLELLLRAEHNRLQHLMRRDVSFEVLWIPELPDQLTEPRDELKALVPGGSGGQDVHVVLLVQEVVPHSLHMGQSLQDDIHVVIGLKLFS